MTRPSARVVDRTGKQCVDVDPTYAARVQFGMTLAFHYLFPPITIGLGTLLVCMEGMFLIIRRPVYEHCSGLNFALGVLTSIPMEFQFGTNWAQYSRFVGDVFGSALAAEGIFAFFLESGFLGLLLFGWAKVPAIITSTIAGLGFSPRTVRCDTIAPTITIASSTEPVPKLGLGAKVNWQLKLLDVT